MSETRLEHIENNLQLLGKLYCRYIDEHPESVKHSKPVTVRCAGAKAGRRRVVKLTKDHYIHAVKAMSNISDWVDEMKAKAAAKATGCAAVKEYRPPAPMRMRTGRRERLS
jgi:hypothetical protein